MSNYYLVEAMCGHVGKGSYIPVLFPVKADSGKEAARIVKKIPRVKHNNKNVILNLRKVSEEEYLNQVEINKNDDYLNYRYDSEKATNANIYSRVKNITSYYFYEYDKKCNKRKYDPEYRKSTTIRLCS